METEISENLLVSPSIEKNKSTKTYKKLKNISAGKLQNTKFKDIDNNCYQSHSKCFFWRKLGLSYSKLPKKCTGIKITNMDMLNGSLQFMSATNFWCKR